MVDRQTASTANSPGRSRAWGLLQGKAIGVDAISREAKAAMRSSVRRDTGDNAQEFLTGWAKVSGTGTRTGEPLSRLDRKRKKRMWK
jgi:hypothetical protein